MLHHLSKSAGRLLGILFFRPQGEFHVRGLARAAGLSPAMASRVLRQLERAGMVKQRMIGNVKLYTANRASPLYPEVRLFLLKTTFLGEALRERLEKLPIRYALVFGSFAAGNEQETSDVDLLIVGDVEEGHLMKAILPVERETQRDINYILWSPAEFRKKVNSGLLKNIIGRKVMMIIGDEREFRKIAAGRPH